MALEENNRKRESQETQLAQIIMNDTIRSAFSDSEGIKGAETIKDILELLQGEKGKEIASDVMGKYCGSLNSIGQHAGGGDMDMRVLRITSQGGLNVASGILRLRLIEQLEEFVNTPIEYQNAMAALLLGPNNEVL